MKASNKVIAPKIKLSQDDMQKGFVKLNPKDKVLSTVLKNEDRFIKVTDKITIAVKSGDNRSDQEIITEWKAKHNSKL